LRGLGLAGCSEAGGSFRLVACLDAPAALRLSILAVFVLAAVIALEA
jgi:hypothetical protein